MRNAQSEVRRFPRTAKAAWNTVYVSAGFIGVNIAKLKALAKARRERKEARRRRHEILTRIADREMGELI
jgi:hypothetical protein